MRINRNQTRPLSLRQPGAALAIGLSAVMLASPAMAQNQGAQAEQEVELDTLKIEGRTADVNPYATEGAPYKAQKSGDVRRVKPLADTPATITVVTETQIEESGLTDLKQILDAQPGITLGTGEGGNRFGDRYIIRGQEMRSDVFVDGLRDPGLTTRESFATEQVEVTKGPSATFAGRGASGGAVNSITKQASSDYDFYNFDLTAGSTDYFRGTVDANVRLSDDVAVRANLLMGTEVVPNRDPADRSRLGAAVAAKAKVTDSLSVLVDYYHLTAKDRPDMGQIIRNVTSGGLPYSEIPSYAQAEDFLHSTIDSVTGRIRFEPTSWLRVENATRYGETRNSYLVSELSAFTRGANDTYAGAQDFRITNKNGWQNMQYFADQLNAYADFTTGSLKHSLVAGFEYSNYKMDQGSLSVITNGANNCINGNGSTLNAICIGDGTGGWQSNLSSLALRTYTRNPIVATEWQVKTKSGYVMDTVDVTPWLSLSGGVRFDNFDYSLITRTLTATTINSVAYAPGDVTGRYSYGDTLWNYNAGLSVKPRENGLVYFAWSTGADINGGESDVGTNCGYGGLCAVNGVLLPTRPERSENLELGTKWDLFDKKLLLTAAIFRTVKKDLMESGANNYSADGSLNTGKLRVQGIELGLTGNITSRLSGQVGVSLMQSKILASSNADILSITTPSATTGGYTGAQLVALGVTNVGKRLANFANRSANAQLRYQLTDALGFGGAVNYQGAMYGGQPDTAAAYVINPDSPLYNQYSIRVPGYASFDAFLTYKLDKNFSLRVNGINLANKRYYTAAYRGGKFAYLGDGRSVRLTLSGKF